MPQSLAQVYLHLTFSTKGWTPCFQDAAFSEEVHAYIAGICDNQDCTAKQVGGYVDHVHILCSLSRRKTIADLVQEVKTSSSIWIKKQKPKWGDFHWQNGYGVFSVSQSLVEKVKEYIANQREHHRTMTFQEEYRMWLREYGIPFDERYMWD